MAQPFRVVVAVAALAMAYSAEGLAQSAGSSVSGAPAAAGPTPSSPAPSGGIATGRSAASEPTPVQRQEDEKAKKDTTICKGC